jgi:hypothetical protein
MSTYDWSTSNGSQNDLLVLRVNPEHGFTELGQVSHDTEVQRSLRIGDNLYSLAQGDLKIADLMHPAHLLADLVLPVPPPITYDPVIYATVAAPLTLQPISGPVFTNPIIVGTTLLAPGNLVQGTVA